MLTVTHHLHINISHLETSLLFLYSSLHRLLARKQLSLPMIGTDSKDNDDESRKNSRMAATIERTSGRYAVLIILDSVLGSGIALNIFCAFIGTARDRATYICSAELLLISY